MTEDDDAPPESYEAVFERTDGSLALPHRADIGVSLAGGFYIDAFTLMRFQLRQEATRRLRAAGCMFRKADQLLFAEVRGDTYPGEHAILAVEIEEALQFLALHDTPPADCLTALETLRQIYWQGEALKAAASDEERFLLRRMALVSCALGFNSATSGIQGVIPSVAELEAQAHVAQKQAVGGDKGRAARQAAASKWRDPLLAFAADWLRRHEVTHGAASRIVAAFRSHRPDVTLPGSDLPQRLVGALIRKG